MISVHFPAKRLNGQGKWYSLTKSSIPATYILNPEGLKSILLASVSVSLAPPSKEAVAILKPSDKVYWLTAFTCESTINNLVPLWLNTIPLCVDPFKSVVTAADLIKLAPPERSKLLFNEYWCKPNACSVIIIILPSGLKVRPFKKLVSCGETSIKFPVYVTDADDISKFVESEYSNTFLSPLPAINIFDPSLLNLTLKGLLDWPLTDRLWTKEAVDML